jgi:hypothetical protein
MSGLVSIKYYRAPIMLRYLVASSGDRRSPSWAEILPVDGNGVVASLHESIPA